MSLVAERSGGFTGPERSQVDGWKLLLGRYQRAFPLWLQVPLLETGDIIIDGGNSEYRDTTVSLSLVALILLLVVDVLGMVCGWLCLPRNGIVEQTDLLSLWSLQGPIWGGNKGKFLNIQRAARVQVPL